MMREDDAAGTEMTVTDNSVRHIKAPVCGTGIREHRN